MILINRVGYVSFTYPTNRNAKAKGRPEAYWSFYMRVGEKVQKVKVAPKGAYPPFLPLSGGIRWQLQQGLAQVKEKVKRETKK